MSQPLSYSGQSLIKEKQRGRRRSRSERRTPGAKSDGDDDPFVGAGAVSQAEEGAGDAHGQPGSAGVAGRTLHLLQRQHPAGPPQSQVLHRAARPLHQPPLPRRLPPRPAGLPLHSALALHPPLPSSSIPASCRLRYLLLLLIRRRLS